MRRSIGITGVITGILLIVVPRYILPACEYAGFSRMHCTDTSNAVLITGALIIIAGAVTLFLKQEKTVWVGAAAMLLLSLVSFMVPDKFGFCHSPKMPCNYGMVPAIRFIAVAGGLVMIAALGILFKNYQRKGTS